VNINPGRHPVDPPMNTTSLKQYTRIGHDLLGCLRYHQMHAPKILARILKSAPPGADLPSWRY